MRERTTWKTDEIKARVAAMQKKADPYLMNQDHVSKNPPAEKYMNGDPSSWAEDVHSPNEWDKEYANGQTKRDEIGMPEKRPETYNHAEKTAADNALLVKKADLCVKVARLMLRKASETAIEDQAVSLMSLADSDLIDTFQRLAGDDEQQSEQAPAQQAQAQEQQQEQAPPAQQSQAQEQQQEQAPAQMEQQAGGMYEQAMSQCMQAMQQGDMDGAKAAIQQMVQQAMGGQQQAPVMASKKKAQDDQGQSQQAPAQQSQAGQQQEQQAGMQQQSMQQMQSMIQTAVQQAVQQALAGQQQAPAEEQAPMQQQATDDMLLDDMLAPGGAADPMMGEIEMEPSPMDVGEIGLGPEDDVLKTLFANQESQDAEQAQEGQKQAAVRTASTRTVGTRPTQGVSRVGGTGAPQTKTASDVDALSSLWTSAPDVSEHFGLK